MAVEEDEYDRQYGRDGTAGKDLPSLYHAGGHPFPNPDWKKGFYYIALKAEMPILLYGVDYERKHIECTKTIIPNGDIDQQMREIKLYFSKFKGKKPENFTIGNN